MWIPKGTILPNLVYVTNSKGLKVAWVPFRQNNITFVGANSRIEYLQACGILIVNAQGI